MARYVEKLKNRNLMLILFDVLVYAVVSFLLLFVRDEIKGLPAHRCHALACLFVPLLLMRAVLKIYHQVWRYATAEEYLLYVLADLAGGVLYILLLRPLLPAAFWIRFWQALSIVAVNCLASLSARFLYQCLYRRGKVFDSAREPRELPPDELAKVRVAIVGAGSAGFYLARELQMNERSRYLPCLFIDNDPQKVGSILSGMKVYPEKGVFERLEAEKIGDVIIALPGYLGEKKQYLFDLYTGHGMRVMVYDLPFAEGSRNGSDFASYADENGKPVLRKFRIEDLLFRSPICVDDGKTGCYYRDKVLLITGGGGSIGSELVRQLAVLKPRRIIVMDCYENNAYDIQQEMRIQYGDTLDMVIEISSVRDERRVNEIVEQYRPDVVIHAAAHKHVPLMEHNCSEALKNNVFGTLNMVNAAGKYGVERFILISTDKAVNPTNVMGATKQICEMIVRSRKDRRDAGETAATSFTAVRFGNVLGSNGSVIPLFKRQIASGGPVTITDKRITRYFMTIPEAAQLVLEAGAMARNGELYVLDMGKPVQILKLAEDMIRLSGLEPYRDIDIQEIGLREGEKLYEELLIQGEELDKTDNELIFVERDKCPTREEMRSLLELLRRVMEAGDNESIRAALRQAVPSYRPQGEDEVDAAPAAKMPEYSAAH